MAKQHKGVSVEEKLKEKLICIEEGMNAERNRSKREGKKQLHSIKAGYVMSHNLSASQTSFFSGSYFFLFFLISHPWSSSLLFKDTLTVLSPVSCLDIITLFSSATQCAARQGVKMMHSGVIHSEWSWCYVIFGSLTSDAAELEKEEKLTS